MDVPDRVICILGMHRSGTSCLTGSLQEAGLQLGKFHSWNPHNRKGNRENQDVVDLNDAVLVANHGSWDRPPQTVRWSRELLQRGRELLATYRGQPNLGFKDPRALLVLEGWKQLLPQLEFVGIFRHPNAVADSLVVRSGGEMSRSEGLALWYQYNRRLLREHRRRPFPVLCFDEPEMQFHAKLDEISRELGLQPVAEGERFYERELRSAGDTGQPLPWKIRRLYRRLCRIAR